jgi:serine/threonine protein kinase
MPPLPQNISEELRDFLVKCFEKDPFNRIDAKGLLEHKWIRNQNKELFHSIMQISEKLPEEVATTLRKHIDVTITNNNKEKGV